MAAVRQLARSCPVLDPQLSVTEAADVFQREECAPYLSLPVVDAEGRALGVVTRMRLHQIFMSRYGRELYGRRDVSRVMTPPVLVEADTAVEQAAAFVSANMRFPVQEDFVLADAGRFLGVGVVVDLLKAMEERIVRRNAELAGAYRQLKQQQAHLVQSEKMASLGQMVAGVAHELNTPLGYVQNNVEMLRALAGGLGSLALANGRLLAALEDPGADEDTIAAAVADARAARDGGGLALLDDLSQVLDDTLYGCTQIAELVASLRDFSRLDRAATENIDINECVNGALLIARNLLKERIEVVRDLGELPPIRCMPSQINQVLLNLVSNAAQAITGRGRILVRTRCADGQVTIQVQDTGKGIAPEHLARIFDPFFTTKPVGEGTGLGLSICYRIIEEHGGTIRVASVPGRGTRFVVALPVESVAVPAAVRTSTGVTA